MGITEVLLYIHIENVCILTRQSIVTSTIDLLIIAMYVH